MDNYTIKLYARARRDLETIYSYIVERLKEPGTAEAMIDLLEDQIRSLKRFPERNPMRRTGIYAGRDHRQMFVKRYVIIYRVFPQKKEVHIISVRYAPSQF